ncbi:MAG: PAS domain S-box protein, partial [Candidatus Limnocylindrales bacterium]
MVVEPSPVHGDSVATLRGLAYQQVEAAVIVTDVDGRIVDWNDGATRLFGWTPGEAVGETWEALAGPVAADPDPRRAEIQARLDGGQGYTGELTVDTRDGGRIPILVSGGPVRDDTGVVVGSIGIAIDDSRRSHAEERFEVAFQASPIASLMTSGPHQLVLDVNPAFEALSGLPRADAIGRTASELGLWDDATVAAAVLDLTRRQLPLTYQAITFRVATGGLVQARVSGRPITLAGGPAYLWMAVDETDRVRAEHELRSTAARLAAVVEASPLAMTLLDGDGVVQLWNPAAERLLGWTTAEVLGRQNPIHSTEGDSSLEQLRTVRRTGEPATVITTVADRVGREVRVEIAL